MATTTAYCNPMSNVEFGVPTIGLKVYVCKGPSGWPETFNRKEADRALIEFLDPLTVDEVVDNFLAARAVAEDANVITWPHITHYLARVLNRPVQLIPAPAVVAFWAQAILVKTEGAN